MVKIWIQLGGKLHGEDLNDKQIIICEKVCKAQLHRKASKVMKKH